MFSCRHLYLTFSLLLFTTTNYIQMVIKVYEIIKVYKLQSIIQYKTRDRCLEFYQCDKKNIKKSSISQYSTPNITHYYIVTCLLISQ